MSTKGKNQLTRLQTRAIGKTIPIFVCTQNINPGDELLTNYNWSNKEWSSAGAPVDRKKRKRET